MSVDVNSSSLFLTQGQKVGLAAATAAAAFVSAEITAHIPADTFALDRYTLARIAANLFAYGAADLAATKFRHPTASLDWQWYGRGGHVVNVAAGLAVTFGVLPALLHTAPLPASIEGDRAGLIQFAALFLGVLPWVLWDAKKNPNHEEGTRGSVAFSETINTAAGSFAATVLEPIVGRLLGASALSQHGILLAAFIPFLTAASGGYGPYLLVGWKDVATFGLSAAEKLRNGIRK